MHELSAAWQGCHDDMNSPLSPEVTEQDQEQPAAREQQMLLPCECCLCFKKTHKNIQKVRVENVRNVSTMAMRCM